MGKLNSYDNIKTICDSRHIIFPDLPQKEEGRRKKEEGRRKKEEEKNHKINGFSHQSIAVCPN
ncbi:MAG: hypothetical protein HC786_07090 [Richelia sp. CSU_2_1]|nr:hypothetical protein [Richelia sp. CSU_2_1]